MKTYSFEVEEVSETRRKSNGFKRNSTFLRMKLIQEWTELNKSSPRIPVTILLKNVYTLPVVVKRFKCDNGHWFILNVWKITWNMYSI